MPESTPAQPEPWMSTPDVSTYSKLPIKTVRQHAASGALRSFRIGKYLRFRREDVDAWMRGGKAEGIETTSSRVAG